jgi:hypothetical protein
MKSRYVGIGIFVVVGSLLFATAVFLIGNQHNFLGIQGSWWVEGMRSRPPQWK